ncbi:MAG: hypothetical protein EAZ91_07465 [Cytophagales bacterium]|nr:MAG: hypothetical protein EAZ91_07465 [Cytophagales bacterium]
MLRFALAIIGVLCLHYSQAQKFTVGEIIKLRTVSYEQFDSFVSRRGYNFIEIRKTEYSTSHAFAFDADGHMASRHIAYIVNKYGEVMITYQTSIVSEYNSIKAGIKQAGFVHSETGEFNNCPFFDYKKGDRTFSITTCQSEDRYGNPKTYYEISLN